jgi:hypothetical protein
MSFPVGFANNLRSTWGLGSKRLAFVFIVIELGCDLASWRVGRVPESKPRFVTPAVFASTSVWIAPTREFEARSFRILESIVIFTLVPQAFASGKAAQLAMCCEIRQWWEAMILKVAD